MFDSQSQDITQRSLAAVSLAHLARESRMNMEAPRSYLVPVLIWITSGQGRMLVDGEMRGYTAHNAIYLPANTSHAFDIGPRSHGTVVFFGGRADLPRPEAMIHLRLGQLQKQNEMNQLVEGLRQDIADAGPCQEEVMFHRAALTLLWLTRETMSNAVRAQSNQAVPFAAGGNGG